MEAFSIRAKASLFIKTKKPPIFPKKKSRGKRSKKGKLKKMGKKEEKESPILWQLV